MPEPTSTTGAGSAALVAIAASLVGVKYGPVVTVATAAFVGAFISLAEVHTAARPFDAARYVASYTLLAGLISGSVSYLIERFSGIPATEILVLVAAVIGWVGGRWKGLLEAALAAGQKMLGKGPARR